MEIEYKYTIPDEKTLQSLKLDARVRIAILEDFQTIHMHAWYFDTPDGLLRRSGASLRLREETPDGGEPRTVCCLKCPPASGEAPENGDALRVREEYECETQWLTDGLELLPARGAPRELLQTARKEGLLQTAALSYTRRQALLRLPGGLECEICLDQGAFEAPGGGREPFWELELEYKAGPQRALARFAAALAADYRLAPQPLSKHARALGLR